MSCDLIGAFRCRIMVHIACLVRQVSNQDFVLYLVRQDESEGEMVLTQGTPAFQQVAAELRKQINSGALPPGSQLPSMAQLREMYGVSNTVVRDALNELRRDGLTIGQQGKGVFVREGGEPGEDSTANEIIQRLEDLTRIVREFDDRLSRLEQADVPGHRTRQ
jgi:GntR family transcriptional regulator